jgi:hypothetical protein
MLITRTLRAVNEYFYPTGLAWDVNTETRKVDGFSTLDGPRNLN